MSEPMKPCPLCGGSLLIEYSELKQENARLREELMLLNGYYDGLMVENAKLKDQRKRLVDKLEMTLAYTVLNPGLHLNSRKLIQECGETDG